MTQEQIDKAKVFHLRHFEYVERLIDFASFAVKPSPEDLSRPELWKDMHWKWFELNADNLRG